MNRSFPTGRRENQEAGHRPSDRRPGTGQTPAIRRRAAVCALGILFVFATLVGRLVQLHWANGPELQRLASRQRVVHEIILPRPGDIVDCRGLVLAASVETQSVYIVPKKLRRGDETIRDLAGALDLEPRLLWEKVARHSQKGFLWVKRRVTDEEATRVRALGLPRDEWGFRPEFQRVYPQGLCAAQVIGTRDVDGAGHGGIEAQFDERLRGKPGRRELLQDARGRVLEVHTASEEPVRHGETIRLTLDTYLQLNAERILDEVFDEWKPKSACAIVLEPRTGALLAMASRPTFDPTRPDLAPADGWTNRTISDQYEPGSTFKPLIVAWALEQGVISRDEVFDCEMGEWRMGGRVLHDHHRYGDLNVSQILAKSSNIGMAKIGVRLTNSRLYDAARAFGFGRRTGIELPAEVPGLVRPPRQWTRYSTGSVPMGQEISATPLQVATAFAVLANGGVLVSPHVVAGRDGAETAGSTPVVSRVIGAETAEWLRRVPLVEAVSMGTGKRAAIPGYAVFGKTGTAQKVDPVNGGYSRSLHVSSFVCGAPAENPRAIVMVSVDEPSVTVNGEHFGGSVAAPAAGRLLKQVLEYYRIPPADLRHAGHEFEISDHATGAMATTPDVMR